MLFKDISYLYILAVAAILFGRVEPFVHFLEEGLMRNFSVKLF